jgi:hypothetical protein
MPELPQIIYIRGYAWERVPRNSTYAGVTYPEKLVRAAGGNPEVVRGPVNSSSDKRGATDAT